MSRRNAIKNTEPTPNKKSSEQIHYESLTNYFKYILGISITFIGIFAAYFGYTRDQNFKTMNEDLTQQKKMIKEELSKMSLELNKKNEQITTLQYETVESLIDYQSKFAEQSYYKIESIGSTAAEIAENKARERISQVFADKNINKFITDVVQDSIELRLGQIVNENITIIESNLVDEEINNIQSNDYSKVQKGITYFQQNPYRKINDEQNKRLISIINSNELNEQQNYILIIFLLGFESNYNTDFFEQILNDNNIQYSDLAAFYFSYNNLDPIPVITNMHNLMQITKPPTNVILGICDLAKSNPDYLLTILNNKLLADYAKNNTSEEEFKNFKNDFISLFEEYLPKEIIIKSYIFTLN